MSGTTPRYDFFQTETQVIVSFYVRGCKQDDVQVTVEKDSLSLIVSEPSPVVSVELRPLFAAVDSLNAGHRVLPTKVEISLQKQQPGHQWPKLLGVAQDSTPAKPSEAFAESSSSAAPSNTVPVLPATTASSTARPRSKWDSFKDEDDAGEADETAEGGGNLDDFFKKIYADADDDTRKAMMKSYQESGGTTLSTNWEEVRKGKVETNPPTGMEARKWDS